MFQRSIPRSAAPFLLIIAFALAACGAPGPDASNPEDDVPCSCAVGSKRCAGEQIQVCEMATADCPSWGPMSSCPSGACTSSACPGNCQDSCPGGTARCAGDDSQEICRIGNSGCLEWVRQPCSAAQYCGTTGQCVAAIPCEGGCPLGYSCQTNGVCSGGRPGEIKLDMKTVTLSGKLTLNTAAPTANSSCSTTANPGDSKADITFTDAKQGYSFTMSSLCQEAGFSFSGMLYPGTYEVRVKRGYYARSNLPTVGYLVNSALVVSADTSGLVFDLKTITLGGKITLNGAAPINDASCSTMTNPGDSKADLTLTDTKQGYTFTMSSLCQDAGFAFSAMIYPGTYEVRVKRGYYARSNLPTVGYLVSPALAVSSDLSGQVFDLKTVTLSGKVTLNGADPAANTSCSSATNPGDSKADITLTDSKQGYSFTMSSLCQDASFAFSAMIYPGTYEVRVKRGYYARSNLPTAAYLVNAAQSITSNLSGQVYNLKTLNIAGSITLNGAAPLTNASCSTATNPGDSKADLTFTDNKQGYNFTLSSLCQDAGFSFSGMLYPGTYIVRVKRGYYDRSNLPTANYLVNSGLAVASDLGGQILNIKTVNIAGKITLNGADPQADASCSETSNPGDSKADLTFVDNKQGYNFTLSSVCQQAGFTFSGMLYPGTYAVRVKRGYYYRSNLPTTAYLVNPALTIGADTSGQVYDIKTIAIAGLITLNGMTPQVNGSCSDMANPGDSKADVTFSEAAQDYSFTFSSLCMDAAFSFSGAVYPGTYEVRAKRGYYARSNLPTSSFLVTRRLRIP